MKTLDKYYRNIKKGNIVLTRNNHVGKVIYMNTDFVYVKYIGENDNDPHGYYPKSLTILEENESFLLLLQR